MARTDATEEEEDVQDAHQPLSQDRQPWQKHFIGVTVGKASVDIMWEDLNFLRPEECLNDNLVVGGAILIAGECRCSQRSIYAFSSHFLTRSLSAGTSDYETVKSWKKQADLFRYDYVLFPICQNHHWYFVVVCHLASWRAWQRRRRDLNTSPSLQESGEAIKPMLLILDPLAQHRPSVCSILKQYVMREAQNKEGVSMQDSDIDTAVASCLPLQRDGYNCGIYTLAYWELFCQNPADFVRHTIQHQRSSRERVSSKPCAGIRADARQRLCGFLQRQHDRHVSGQLLKVPDRHGLLVEAPPVETLIHLRTSSFDSLTNKDVAVPGDSRSLQRVRVHYSSRSEPELDGVRWDLQLELLGRSIRQFVDAYLDHPLHVVQSSKPQALADIECLRAGLFGTGKHDCRALEVFSPPVRDYIQTCAYLSTAVMRGPQECTSSLGLETERSRAQPVRLFQHTGDPLARENNTGDGPELSRDATDRPSYDTLVDRFWNLLPHLPLAGTAARPGQPRRELRALLEQAFHCGHILQDALATNPEYRLFLPCHGERFEKATMSEVCTGQTGGELVALCLRPGVHVAASQVVIGPAVVTLQLPQCGPAVQGFPDGASDARVKGLNDIRSESSEERLGGALAEARNGTSLETFPVAGEDIPSSRQSLADLTQVDCVAAPRDQNPEGDSSVGAVDVRRSPRLPQVQPNDLSRVQWAPESPLKRKNFAFGGDHAIQVSLQQIRKYCVIDLFGTVCEEDQDFRPPLRRK